MCGVLAAINIPIDELKGTMKNLSYRGRDGWGYWHNNGMYKEINNIQNIDLERFKIKQEFLTIANSRAIPTTEFQTDAGQDIKNQQPFENEDFIVVQNGIITNDNEIRKEFNIKTKSNVDTAILPYLFNSLGVIEGLKKIEGSYSIICYDKKNDILYAAKNFMPLRIYKDKNKLLITSIKEMTSMKTDEIEPYTCYKINMKTNLIDKISLWKNSERNKKVLVICSSGIDSATTAFIYKFMGYEVSLIHFLYNQAAEDCELHSVKLLAKDLNSELIIYDARNIFEPFKEVSRLLREKEADSKDQLVDAESTFSYVPNRNAIFAMIAGGIAEMKKIDTVSFGGQQQDSVYPDNNPTFVDAVDTTFKYSLNWHTNIKFAAPLIHLIKHEIIELGIKIDVPYEHTCSCYYPELKDGKVIHCGKCGCCQFRYNAFKMLGVKDKANWKTEIDTSDQIVKSKIINTREFIDKYIRAWL